MKTPSKSKNDEALVQRVKDLLRGPQFLHHVSDLIGSLGVVREECNRLILFLAMLTVRCANPVSVVVKGPSSSGKSNLVRTVLRVLPPNVVLYRTSLTKRALEYGDEDLGGKVLYIGELQGAKDAQLSRRLLQTEGHVAHEATTIRGPERSTELACREGSPVVVTTTTESQILEDDETRFLSLQIDQSDEQTREIVKAQLHQEAQPDDVELRAVQIAVRALLTTEVVFQDMPAWLDSVIDHLPTSVRTRRDWPRFLSLLQAIALTRLYCPGALSRGKLTVNFSDYAIAYRLLNVAFSRSPVTVGASTAELVAAAAKLYLDSREPVSVAQISTHLRWEYQRTHKHVHQALQAGLLRREKEVRQKNEKRLIPTDEERDDFLLSPQELLKRHPELEGCQYVDPITGEMKQLMPESAERTPEKSRGATRRGRNPRSSECSAISAREEEQRPCRHG